MAFGLPVEGEEGPFAGEVAVPAPTCLADEQAATVARRLADQKADRVLVLGPSDVVLGSARRPALEQAGEQAVGLVMEVVPSTVRPSVVASSLTDAEEPVVITTAAGTLVGVVEPRQETPGPADDDAENTAAAVVETAHALEEHFGDRQPSEEEVEEFLRERLVSEGKSPEEADRILKGS